MFRIKIKFVHNGHFHKLDIYVNNFDNNVCFQGTDVFMLTGLHHE